MKMGCVGLESEKLSKMAYLVLTEEHCRKAQDLNKIVSVLALVLAQEAAESGQGLVNFTF